MRKATKSGVWKLASEYNRRKDCIDGYGNCCSCGAHMHWKEGDAGHFIPRARGKACYFIPTNIHLQCRYCNSFNQEAAKISYTLYMLDRYGLEHIQELQTLARTVHRQRQSDLDTWAEFYRVKLAELEMVDGG